MTSLKNLLMIVATILIWTIVWTKINPKPTTLSDFCKGDPEVMITLEGKGLSDGTLYLKCNGELYQSKFESITHHYDENNNQVRAYGDFGGEAEHFELDTSNGGV